MKDILPNVKFTDPVIVKLAVETLGFISNRAMSSAANETDVLMTSLWIKIHQDCRTSQQKYQQQKKNYPKASGLCTESKQIHSNIVSATNSWPDPEQGLQKQMTTTDDNECSSSPRNNNVSQTQGSEECTHFKNSLESQDSADLAAAKLFPVKDAKLTKTEQCETTELKNINPHLLKAADFYSSNEQSGIEKTKAKESTGSKIGSVSSSSSCSSDDDVNSDSFDEELFVPDERKTKTLESVHTEDYGSGEIYTVTENRDDSDKDDAMEMECENIEEEDLEPDGPFLKITNVVGNATMSDKDLSMPNECQTREAGAHVSDFVGGESVSGNGQSNDSNLVTVSERDAVKSSKMKEFALMETLNQPPQCRFVQIGSEDNLQPVMMCPNIYNRVVNPVNPGVWTSRPDMLQVNEPLYAGDNVNQNLALGYIPYTSVSMETSIHSQIYSQATSRAVSYAQPSFATSSYVHRKCISNTAENVSKKATAFSAGKNKAASSQTYLDCKSKKLKGSKTGSTSKKKNSKKGKTGEGVEEKKKFNPKSLLNLKQYQQRKKELGSEIVEQKKKKKTSQVQDSAENSLTKVSGTDFLGKGKVKKPETPVGQPPTKHSGDVVYIKEGLVGKKEAKFINSQMNETAGFTSERGAKVQAQRKLTILQKENK